MYRVEKKFVLNKLIVKYKKKKQIYLTKHRKIVEISRNKKFFSGGKGNIIIKLTRGILWLNGPRFCARPGNLTVVIF